MISLQRANEVGVARVDRGTTRQRRMGPCQSTVVRQRPQLWRDAQNISHANNIQSGDMLNQTEVGNHRVTKTGLDVWHFIARRIPCDDRPVDEDRIVVDQNSTSLVLRVVLSHGAARK